MAQPNPATVVGILPAPTAPVVPSASPNLTVMPSLDPQSSAKRGQDQIQSGYSLSEESMGKRAKTATQAGPSKVVHVRGLPDNTQEYELTALASAFGPVSNVLIMKGKGQAFVEMGDVVCASQFVQYYNSVQAQLRFCALLLFLLTVVQRQEHLRSILQPPRDYFQQ